MRSRNDTDRKPDRGGEGTHTRTRHTPQLPILMISFSRRNRNLGVITDSNTSEVWLTEGPPGASGQGLDSSLHPYVSGEENEAHRTCPLSQLGQLVGGRAGPGTRSL